MNSSLEELLNIKVVLFSNTDSNFQALMDCASISSGTVRRYERSVRASSLIWASEASLVRTSVLARLVSLAQIGELARRLLRA